MVDSSKPASSQESSTRIKFANIFETVDASKRRTKIICTLGQACNDVDQIIKMLDAGMNVARLDFAVGDHKSHGIEVSNLQAALKQRPDKFVAVMLETKGPEIRTCNLADGKDVNLNEGQFLEIFTDTAMEGNDQQLACNYKGLPSSVNIGSKVCFGEGGQVVCEVLEVYDVSLSLLFN